MDKIYLLYDKLVLYYYKYKLNKTNDIYYKIKYIIRKNPDIYNSLNNVSLNFLTDNIISELVLLESILDKNLNKDRLDAVLDIKNINLINWYTDDGYILNNYTHFNKWLDYAYEIIKLRNILQNNQVNSIEQFNFLKINSIYLYYKNNIDMLYNRLK